MPVLGGTKLIPIVPRMVMWAAGVVAGLAIARLAKREYGRVNEELDEARFAPVSGQGAVGPSDIEARSSDRCVRALT